MCIRDSNYGDLNGKTGAGIPTTDMFGVTKAGTYPYRGAVLSLIHISEPTRPY